MPVDSALGRHVTPELSLRFSEAHQWIGFGMKHLDLLSSLEVYVKLREWLGVDAATRDGASRIEQNLA